MKRIRGLFVHIYRMDNSRKVKSLITGMMEGAGRKERKEDIEDWCQTDVLSAAQIVQDREAW